MPNCVESRMSQFSSYGFGILSQQRNAAADLLWLRTDDLGVADRGVDLRSRAEVDQLDAIRHGVLEHAVIDAQRQLASVAPGVLSGKRRALEKRFKAGVRLIAHLLRIVEAVMADEDLLSRVVTQVGQDAVRVLVAETDVVRC